MLCAVEGLTGDEAATKSGSEVGAKYCWKNAMGDNLADSAKTTSVSRAWRRSAKWLRDISKTKLRTKASAVQWRLMHYIHPKPYMATATPEQLSAMRAFEAWQRSLTRGVLLQPAVVDMLHSLAGERHLVRNEAVEMAQTEVPMVGPAQDEQHRKARPATARLATQMGSSSGL